MLIWWTAGTLEVMLCGRWCLHAFCGVSGGKRNDRSFEDCERTLERIKLLFFNTLYLYTYVFVSPLVIKYHDFLVLFAPIHRVYLGRPTLLLYLNYL
jgi:hypothetical protein